MTKIMFVLNELPGKGRSEALEHWRTTHMELVRVLPGIMSYSQFHALAAPDGSPAPYLGIALLEFADAAAFAVAAASPEFAAAVADLSHFADADMPTAVVEQVDLSTRQVSSGH